MVCSGRTSALKSQKNSGNFHVAITGNIVKTVKINFIYDYRLQKAKIVAIVAKYCQFFSKLATTATQHHQAVR